MCEVRRSVCVCVCVWGGGGGGGGGEREINKVHTQQHVNHVQNTHPKPVVVQSL